VELYKNLLKLKNKNKNINISKLKYEEVIDEIFKIENDILVTSLINKFPSEQKEIAKDMLTKSDTKSDTYYNIFLKISKKDNIEIFTKKISSYKDARSLYNAASIFSKDINNTIEYIENTLKGLDSKIVFKNDDTLIINVISNSDLIKLASDSAWCILKESTWLSYVKNGRKQFILLDYSRAEFDPMFKIGFTMNPDSTIHAAHDILDNEVDVKGILSKKGFDITLPNWAPTLMDVKNITSMDGITKLSDISNFIKYCSIDVLKLNVPKILDRFRYGIGVNGFKLTGPKDLIVKQIIKKLFSSLVVISDKDLEAVDKRFIEYYKSKTYSNYVNPKYMLVCKKSYEIIEHGMAIWSDQIVIDYSSNTNSIFKRDRDYSEFNIDNFYVDKRSLELLCNRYNLIYQNKDIINSNNLTSLINFYRVLIKLNYSLGNKNIDDSLKKYIPDNYKKTYIGLFQDTIDLKSTDYYDLSDSFPVEKIIKRDYPETNIYLPYYGKSSPEIEVCRLIKHLEGYKIMINIRKHNFTFLFNRMFKVLKTDDNNKYLREFCEVLKMFNMNRITGSKTIGNLTIKIP